MPEMIPRVDYRFIGLDIGRMKDYSAVSLVERWYRYPQEEELPKPQRYGFGDKPAVKRGVEELERMYTITDLFRFPLKTEYTKIAEVISSIWDRPLVSSGRRIVIADQTGVGAPVVEMIRKRRVRVIGVNITGGLTVKQPEENVYNVPKAALVTQLVSVFERGRVKIAIDPNNSEAIELREQLRGFGYKLNRETGQVSYESLEAQTHDDMVIAVALPIWYAEAIVPSLTGRLRPSDIAPTHDPWEKEE